MSTAAMVLVLVLLVGMALAVYSRVQRQSKDAPPDLSFDERMDRYRAKERRRRDGLSGASSGGLLGAWFVGTGGDGGWFGGGFGDGGGGGGDGGGAC